MNRKPKKSDTKFFSKYTKYKNIILILYLILIDMGAGMAQMQLKTISKVITCTKSIIKGGWQY